MPRNYASMNKNIMYLAVKHHSEENMFLVFRNSVLIFMIATVWCGGSGVIVNENSTLATVNQTNFDQNEVVKNDTIAVKNVKTVDSKSSSSGTY
jgi:hypothetical protein